MAHKYMSYSRDAQGLITRNHNILVLDDVSEYHHKEHLSGWPERSVFWMLFADGSAAGIAPMTDKVEKEITHYSTGVRSGNRTNKAS